MTPNLNELADRLESFIPRGDGYNSDYANTLVEAVEVLRAKAAPAEPEEKILWYTGSIHQNIRKLRAENAELAETLGAVRGSIEGLITLWFATREHGCLPVAVIKATAAVKIIDAALATTTSMEQSHE